MHIPSATYGEGGVQYRSFSIYGCPQWKMVLCLWFPKGKLHKIYTCASMYAYAQRITFTNSRLGARMPLAVAGRYIWYFRTVRAMAVYSWCTKSSSEIDVHILSIMSEDYVSSFITDFYERNTNLLVNWSGIILVLGFLLIVN